MATNNAEVVYDVFCQSSILAGPISNILQAKQVAEKLNQYYANYGLHLSPDNILGKTSREVEVILDKQLAENYNHK